MNCLMQKYKFKMEYMCKWSTFDFLQIKNKSNNNLQ